MCVLWIFILQLCGNTVLMKKVQKIHLRIHLWELVVKAEMWVTPASWVNKSWAQEFAIFWDICRFLTTQLVLKSSMYFHFEFSYCMCRKIFQNLLIQFVCEKFNPKVHSDATLLCFVHLVFWVWGDGGNSVPADALSKKYRNNNTD